MKLQAGTGLGALSLVAVFLVSGCDGAVDGILGEQRPDAGEPIVVADADTSAGPIAEPDPTGDESPVIENPDANPGAPDNGTPFPDIPAVDTGSPEAPGPVSAETGEPVVLTPAPEAGVPAPSQPDPSQPEPSAPAPSTPEPAPTQPSEPATPVTPPATPPAPPTAAPSFFYYPPGDLEPGSGKGSKETLVFVPDMRFPIKSAPSYPQSQVYRYGGGVKGGAQCDARNFSAPWRDNYCETRSSGETAFCPVKGVHLGQDIRVGDRAGCIAESSAKPADRTRYEIVAAEDGVISNVGSYSISLRAEGRIYRYLHLNMSKLKVAMGQEVKKGDVVGYVSNDFGGTPTTLHLHFEIKVNTAEHGWQYAPPYTSLLAAYQRRENNPGEMVMDDPIVATSATR